MRSAVILFKGEEAGILTQHDDGAFTFRYNDAWMADRNKPCISLTLPKSQQEYHSPYLSLFSTTCSRKGQISRWFVN